jgi:hypothetical protein
MSFPGRTTATAIESIIDVAPGDVLDPFIDTANELVTEKCAVVFPGSILSDTSPPTYVPAPNGFMYSDYRLELIERWLSAHFYGIFSQVTTMEKAGSVASAFQGKSGMALDLTFWGQQALMLDTMGALAVMSNAAQKYAKVPPGLLQGVQIGVVWMGIKRRPFPWFGGGSWGQF